MRLIPAEVVSWDGKELRVKIQGYTDGASKSLKADVLYPFGDRPSRTGFRILPGDAVWVLFNGGEIDNPIVVGFRNKNTGGNKDVRLFTHKNFFLEIDESTTVQCPNSIYLGKPLFTERWAGMNFVNLAAGLFCIISKMHA